MRARWSSPTRLPPSPILRGTRLPLGAAVTVVYSGGLVTLGVGVGVARFFGTGVLSAEAKSFFCVAASAIPVAFRPLSPWKSMMPR